LYNVVLTGELLKGQSIMQAANSLSKLFKIAPIQAQQMLARAPLVIKKNLEEDTAIRFVQAMYKSGFGAAVEEQKATKTTFLQPFASHLDDEDDEEAAVTRITPVLVEQSRLEESLDTELTIPAATTPAPSPQAEPTPEPLAAELLANGEQSNQFPEEIAGLPLAEESAVAEHYLVEEIDAFDVAPPAAQVQELLIAQVSAEHNEPELLAGAELSEETQANIAEEVVQLSVEDSVEQDEQQESPSEPFGLEAEIATEVSAEAFTQEAEVPSRAESFDPFGQFY
jgi:hypothetical protein